MENILLGGEKGMGWKNVVLDFPKEFEFCGQVMDSGTMDMRVKERSELRELMPSTVASTINTTSCWLSNCKQHKHFKFECE